MRRVRVFLSSPGDVWRERELTAEVLEHFALEFKEWLIVEAVDWRTEPLPATDTFQAGIPSVEAMDIFICILWSRLGSPLPESFLREDGTRYRSGTEYEFEMALRSWEASGAPHVLVYRKLAPIQMERGEALNPEMAERRVANLRIVEEFFQTHFRGADQTFTRAMSEFNSTEEFLGLLRPQLRKLLEERMPRPEDEVFEGPERGSWHRGSPFRGLNEFQLDDADVFFGRSKAVSEVYAALKENAAQGCRAVFVLGASGSGKSSLLQAGVAPVVMRPNRLGEIGAWHHLSVDPSALTADPALGFAKAITAPGALPELLEEFGDVSTLAKTLRDAPDSAALHIQSGLTRIEAGLKLRDPEQRLVRAGLFIVIDQFEEFFNIQAANDAAARGFLRVLTSFATQPRARIWIGVAMRSDFYDECAAYPDIVALMSGSYFLLPPTASELRQIVSWPARAAGLSFEKDETSRRSLDEVLCDEAINHPECLPLLEFALQKLYELGKEERVLRFSHYEAFGRLSGAIAQTAEDLFRTLPQPAQDAFPQVLLPMVQVAQEEGPVARQYVLYREWIYRPECIQLVDAFVAHRLFVKASDPEGNTTVTVAHEAVLREWQRAQDVIEASQRLLQMRNRVRELRAIWSRNGDATAYLLRRGLELEAGRELARAFRDGLATEDLRYIDLSEAHEQSVQRAKRRRFTLRATGLLLFLLLCMVGLIANVKRNARLEIQRQREETEKQNELQKNTTLQLGMLTYRLPRRFEHMQSARSVLVKFLGEFDGEIRKGFSKYGQSETTVLAEAQYLRTMGEARIATEEFKEAKEAVQEAIQKLDDFAKSDLTLELQLERAECLRVYALVLAHEGDVSAAKERLLKAGEYLNAIQHAPGREHLGVRAAFVRATLASQWGLLALDSGPRDLGPQDSCDAWKNALPALDAATGHLEAARTAAAQLKTADNVTEEDIRELKLLTAERLSTVHVKLGIYARLECDKANPAVTTPDNEFKTASALLEDEHALTQSPNNTEYAGSVQFLYDDGMYWQKKAEISYYSGAYADAVAQLKSSEASLKTLVQREPSAREFLDALAVTYILQRHTALDGRRIDDDNTQVIALSDTAARALKKAIAGELRARQQAVALTVQKNDEIDTRTAYSDSLWDCAQALAATGPISEQILTLYANCLAELRRAEYLWQQRHPDGAAFPGRAHLNATEDKLKTLTAQWSSPWTPPTSDASSTAITTAPL